MAEFKLGRIRFVWKNNWTTGTTYYKDDVVQYGGKVFICITGHTASVGFYTDLDAVPSKWNQMSDGFAWENDWTVGTDYKTNDMVKYGGRLYICRIPHTSAATLTLGLEADLNLADSTLSKWDNVADGIDWKNTWTISTRYKVNDVVKYGGITYICNTYHTSAVSLASGLEADIGKWDVFNRGIEYKTAWTTVTRYKVNDVVKFGSTLYICTLFHTSGASFDLDTAYWTSFVEGLQFENTWTGSVQYQPGDIVRYGGYQYVAKTTHTSSTPSTGTTDWDLFSKGFSFTTDWSSSTSYKVGEVVSLGGNTYLCTADHSNQSPPNSSYWEKLSSGVNWRNYWANSTPYYVGDTVRYGSNVYICITKHTSNDDDSTTFADSTRSPSGDTEGVYWNIFNVGSEYSVMSDAGDMVYYNGNQGPARLPIGKEGMVLKVSADSKPEWAYLGVVDYTFYVAPHGQDLPAPTWGLTQDKPWKTIRYACMQIDKGARNPNAQYLLEMNRVFIQREVSEWIQYQIANNRSPYTTSFVYDEFKCERDVGFVVDRLIWDIGHGGNLKTLAAALSYINALSGADLFATAFDENGTGTYSKLAAQSTQDVAAYNYMLTVVQAVLNNTAVAASYQTINGDNSTSILGQYFNSDLPAESGVYTTITSLVGIITKALTEQVVTNLPDRYVPNSILNVKSGAWSEVLPIPVPAETSIVGDETRAVQVSADTGSIDISDSYATYTTFGRLSTVMGQIVTGTTVTPTTGNTKTQSLYWPYASSAETTKISSLVDVMKYQADYRLGTMAAATITDPTGYNTSYLIGYGDARKLLKENKKFLKEEVVAYLEINYPTSKYGKTKTRRDAGYIIDAAIYALTYGGNSLSIKAGLAYFDAEGSTNLIPASIKTLTLAAIAFLKSRMQSVATNSTVTALQTAVPQFFDTAGSAAASTLIGTNVDIIYNLINGGSTTFAPNITVTTITSTTTLATASAHGLAVGDTFVPRSTANGLDSGTKYYVVSVPLATTFTLAASFGGSAIATLTNGTGLTIVGDVVSMPAATNAVTTTTALISAYTSLTAAVETIVTGGVDYINTNYGSFKYNSAICRRDSGYLVDAAYYDAAFGSNFWAVQNGISYLRYQAGVVINSQKTQEVAAIGYIKTQVAAAVVSDATAVSRADAAYTEVIDIINNGVANADALVYTDTGTANFTNARAQLVINRAFIITTLTTWLSTNYSTLWNSFDAIGKAKCQRDIGYTVDALAYDVNYGGNTATRNICRSLFNNITGVSVYPSAQQKTASAAMYTQLGVVCAQIVVETYAGQDVSGTAASATEATRMTTLTGNINSVIVADSLSGLVAESLPSISWVAGGIQTALGTLATNKTTIVKGTLQFLSNTYNSFTYSHAKAERDASIILEAVGYDFMFNTNYRTVSAALAYLRANSIELYTTTYLKAATRGALSYAKTQALASVGGNATAQARIETLMTLVDSVIFGAANEGDMCQSVYDDIYYANLQLERNRAFIVEEARAYIANTFKSTATGTTITTDVITVADTSWMTRNLAIEFTGTIPSGAGISTGVTYYVQNIVSSTTFTVATTRFASTANRVTLATKAGSWTVKMVYNSALCLRDVGYYIDAVKWDLVWSSNYKSRYVARYYANAVLGSQEEDFFYLRNGTGIKNMSLRGLSGQLTPENAYGTSRTTAGAYASLDPGWGPADFRTWITSRSPYIQNNATFGNAAIGQKIDGSLHNGGNKSFVSNDFTQLISDGIGAWVTNNARAELVSVFTYYSHIGYLSEAGGRIRGTNGNNSYGDFGSVAEGYDVTEAEKTAIVDNKFQYKAVVGSVTTDGSAIYAYEFDHAGNEYTEATWLIVGPGNFADIEQDEFRDDAVYQVRLIDNVDDSTAAPEADGNQGGSGYLYNNGTAQSGTTTSITLSAVDDQLSSAYLGMKIIITAGNGIGNFALINAYNSGTKVADLITESTGAAGWDHFVAGTPIVAPDSSSSYIIEPAVSFTAPSYSSTASTLPTSGTWTVVKYGDTSAGYSSLTGTYTGSGINARFTVVRNGSKYASVTIDTAGTGYIRLETITILGTSLGGTTPANDLVITITSVSTLGAILAFDTSGYGLGGRFVAMRSGSVIGATSEDGISWTTRTSLMPSGASWSASAWGYFNDGSSLPGESSSRFVAVAGGSANTTGAWSADGITWNATSMNTSATWVDVCYGEGRFVALASDSQTVRISSDGENWDTTGTLARTGYTCIAYGLGLYVAARSGSTIGAWSTDGVTWIEITMPSASSWGHIAFGNGRFVALSQSSGTALAYSITGKVWYEAALPVSASWTNITYGQGVFLAVTNSTQAATSQDGINWTSRTMSTAASGFTAVSFGNPQRAGKFVAVGGGTGTVASYTYAGAKARARAFVSSEKITAIRLLEPGSGYASAPTITITDPNNIYEAPTTVRIGDGVLAMPSIKNRGTGYVTASAEIDKGDGYADFFQDGAYVAVRRISAKPAAGSNLVFAGKDTTYKIVSVVSFRGDYDGSYTAFFQISPTIKVFDNLAHGTAVTTRIRYSQVRLTGHDFLDIGTGSFTETNYPNTPTQSPIQANECVEGNSGRVFFTSTDQDGNFRVGSLFTIEQSTGVATLNADAFNLSGLQEISLGNLTLGGASARVTEFSTDPFFTQNSDSVIPTQRAIKAYIASQIGGGGASLIVNSVTAGDILVGTNTITNVTGGSIIMGSVVNFTGGVTGYPLAISYFLN